MNVKHNPHFGEIFCSYVAFRPYNSETEEKRLKNKKKRATTFRQ